jgi:hypothetical protein
VQPAERQLVEVDRRPGTGQAADVDDRALDPGGGQQVAEAVAADVVEHDVGAPAVRRRRHRRGQVVGRRVDHHVGADSPQGPGLGRAGRRGDDRRRAQRPGQLHADHPDARCGADDDDPVARPEPGLHEGVVLGGDRHRQAARVGPRQALGHRHQVAVVDHGVGRERSQRRGHHPVADRDTADAVADRGDLAGQLQARGVRTGSRAAAGVVPTLQHGQVGAVEAGRPHPDEHLARARSGDLHLPPLPVGPHASDQCRHRPVHRFLLAPDDRPS